MKLKNSTDFPDYFLRRLVSWCCRQSGLPVGRLRSAEFRNTAKSYSGSAYNSMRIVVRIGGPHHFPLDADTRQGMQGEAFADRLEALVSVSAHEVEHCCQYAENRSHALNRRRGIVEPVTRAHEVRCLRLFRENRVALLAEWGSAPAKRAAKPKLSRQERNERRARLMLARWERKLKTAQGKVRTLRAKARYYDRIAAKRAQA